MVYLKIQPYKANFIDLAQISQFALNDTWPLQKNANVGDVAYKLLFPEGCQFPAPPFMLVNWKGFLVPTPNPPLRDVEGNIKVYPLEIKGRRVSPIKWTNLLGFHVI